MVFWDQSGNENLKIVLLSINCLRQSLLILTQLPVKANLAKPMYKGRLAKHSRGGYKIQKNVEATEEPVKSKKKKKAKSKEVHDKNETQPNLKSSNNNIASKSQDKNLKEKKASQTVQSAKGQKRGRNGTDVAVNQQPSKKARKNHNYGKGRGRPSTSFSNPRSSYSSNPYVPRPTTYAPPATSYAAHAYPGASGSQLRRTDLDTSLLQAKSAILMFTTGEVDLVLMVSNQGAVLDTLEVQSTLLGES